MENKFAGRVAYNNFLPGKQLGDSLTFFSELNKDKSRSVKELPTMKPAPWEFEKRAKQALYQFQPSHELPEEPICERQGPASEDKEDSIFDKHFYGTEKEVTPHSEQETGYASNLQEVVNPISLSIKDGPFPVLSSSSLYEHRDTFDPSATFKLRESSFNNIPVEETTTAALPRVEHTRKSEENLFTPLELLNECRNFLKHRGDSSQKSNVQLNPIDPNPTPLLELNDKMPMKQPMGKEHESLKKEEDSGYIFPEIKESSKKSEGKGSTHKEDYNYTHFETFANAHHDHKPTTFPTLPLPTFPVRHTFQGLHEEKLPNNFSIEDFLETLMEATDMSPFITVKSLNALIATQPNGEVLRSVLAKELAKDKEEELCLPELA